MMLLVVLITNVECTQVFFSDLYNTVVHSCIVVSDMCLPKTCAKKGSSKVASGWNEHIQTYFDAVWYAT